MCAPACSGTSREEYIGQYRQQALGDRVWRRVAQIRARVFALCAALETPKVLASAGPQGEHQRARAARKAPGVGAQLWPQWRCRPWPTSGTATGSSQRRSARRSEARSGRRSERRVERHGAPHGAPGVARGGARAPAPPAGSGAPLAEAGGALRDARPRMSRGRRCCATSRRALSLEIKRALGAALGVARGAALVRSRAPHGETPRPRSGLR